MSHEPKPSSKQQRRNEWYIRRARPEDARAIHEVHMRSIREVCSKDHTLAEVMAWGGRPYDETRRQRAIHEDLVWVVQRKGIGQSEIVIEALHNESIGGFAMLSILKKGQKHWLDKDVAQETTAHIRALYFGSELLGLGFGQELVKIMLDEARKAGAKEVTLESSLTAHEFYKRCGFFDSGSMTHVEINGEKIRCYPMFRTFHEVTAVDL